MRKYQKADIYIMCEKEEINGNWYYIMVWEEPKNNYCDHLVIIMVRDSGKEMFYTHPDEVEDSSMEKIYQKREPAAKDIDMSTFVSDALNSAICKFEKKQNQQKRFQDKIRAAIESNKEIHENELNML